MNPVNNSISGYCHNNFFLQQRLLPFKTKNENTGIKSYQAIFFRQKSQCDRPRIDWFFGRRLIKTFKKEPMEAPIINKKYGGNTVEIS